MPVKHGGQLTRNRMLNVFNRRCLRDIMGVLWKDHMTNEQLLSSVGIEDLQDIMPDRRRRFTGHVLRLPTSRPASLVRREEVEDGAGQGGHGRIHAEKICKKCVSAAVTLMKPGALPVIVLNGDDSSPSVPVGTGGPKSK